MTVSRWMAILSIGAIVPFGVGVGGCGGDEESDQSAAPTATEAAQETVTGIGATDADWEDTHEPDPEFAPGSAYDPDPSLVAPGEDPTFSSRYYLVSHSGGRIESYEMRFAPDTSISEAKPDTLAEFPDDAKVDWFRTVPASGFAGPCAQMQVSSAALTRELGAGPTAGLVEFSSGEAANSYNPDAVSTASLVLLPPKPPSKAIGC